MKKIIPFSISLLMLCCIGFVSYHLQVELQTTFQVLAISIVRLVSLLLVTSILCLKFGYNLIQTTKPFVGIEVVVSLILVCSTFVGLGNIVTPTTAIYLIALMVESIWEYIFVLKIQRT